jgi:hypothetical protein
MTQTGVPKFVLAGAIVAVMLAGVVDVAHAASSSTTIRACASKKGGALRVASVCKKSEKRVTWNSKGPRGSQGVQGIPGTARAYGMVDASGQLDSTVAHKGISKVTNPNDGIYCVTFAPSVHVSSTTFGIAEGFFPGGSAAAYSSAEYLSLTGPSFPCAANSLAVLTGTDGSGGLTVTDYQFAVMVP